MEEWKNLNLPIKLFADLKRKFDTFAISNKEQNNPSLSKDFRKFNLNEDENKNRSNNNQEIVSSKTTIIERINETSENHDDKAIIEEI